MAAFLPIVQFFNNDGNMLSNGTLTCYKSNTSTLQSAYTNQGAGTALENPVQLNAYGRPTTSGSIWLNGEYTLVLKDSEGNMVGVPVDNISSYNPIDWSTLTATLSQINTLRITPGTSGTVYPNQLSIVDSSKNIATYGTLTAANLVATTGVATPLIQDANGIRAITIDTTTSQVNSITMTPGATGTGHTIAATGSDGNITTVFKGKGSTGACYLNNYVWPLADGNSGYGISTNGSNSWSFTNPSKLTAATMSNTSIATAVQSTLYTIYSNTIFSSAYFTNIFNLTITPTATGSLLLFNINLKAGTNTSPGRGAVVALFDSANLSTPLASTARIDGLSLTDNLRLVHVLTTTSTSAKTYQVMLGTTASSTFAYVNGGSSGSQVFGGVSSSTATVMEILPS